VYFFLLYILWTIFIIIHIYKIYVTRYIANKRKELNNTPDYKEKKWVKK